MVLRRLNTGSPVAQLRNEMDWLVQDFFGRGSRPVAPTAAGFQALNFWEDGDSLFAEAELPGVKSEDLDISVMAGDLTIQGRRSTMAGEGAAFHRQERGAGQFNRVVRLPFEVDAQRVEASLRDGVLLVKLPKAESAKPKKIAIRAAE
jgi:HSP20 family protein